MGISEWSWEGALVAFLTFHAVKGVDMLMWAYVSIYENRAWTPGEDPQAEGRGYILNYFVQMLVMTVAGSYVVRHRTASNFRNNFTGLDFVLLLTIATILLWNRFYPKRPLLRRVRTGVVKLIRKRDVGRENGTDSQDSD